MKNRLLKMINGFAVIFSQMCNVIFGNLFSGENPWGNPDLTVSACLYIENSLYRKDKPYIKFFHDTVNVVFFWDSNHCKKSFQKDYAHARYVMDLILILGEAKLHNNDKNGKRQCEDHQ